jgi:hypothetical protein
VFDDAIRVLSYLLLENTQKFQKSALMSTLLMAALQQLRYPGVFVFGRY